MAEKIAPEPCDDVQLGNVDAVDAPEPARCAARLRD